MLIAVIKISVSKKKAVLVKASRSLNVLIKNEKGLLSEYQRPFSIGINLLQLIDAGDCVKNLQILPDRAKH